MKKMNYLLALAAMAVSTMGFVSCSDDAVLEETTLDQTLKTDKSFYIPITVSGYNDTRAGELDKDYTTENPYDPTQDPNFNSGTEQENKVTSIHLVFYNASGERLSSIEVLKELTSGAGILNSENALYTGVVQVDVQRGSTLPAYVLAFINPTNTADFMASDDFATLANVEKATRRSLISGTDFAMSNSVYYDTDPVTGATNTRIMATPVVTGKLFTSEAAAKKAIEDNPEDAYVDIYVERYAAKVNFSVTAEGSTAIVMKDGADDESTTTFSLTFVPEYWTINADESVSYITKNFFAPNADDETFNFDAPASYETMNTALAGWMWNSPTHHRSYWGQSPAYYVARYPRVADDITDNPAANFPLKYYSYEEIEDNAKSTAYDAKAKAVGTGTTFLYTRENTVSGSALKTAAADPLASPRAAIASVVMVGHYEVKYGDETVTLGDDELFYVTGNKTNGYKYYTEDAMLAFFLGNTIALASDEEGKPLTEEEQAKYLTLIHPSADVRGNLVIDSRYVTLQLTEEAIGNVYAKVGDDYAPVTEDNIVLVNQRVMSGAGTAYGFHGGKAYFNVPIQHLGYYRTGNTNATIAGGANSADFEWEKVQSGDFGIVRNHIYTINVSKIEGLGNAIPNPDEPIVPPTDPEDYYIGARIVVLNWAVVPTQDVEL